MIDDKNFFDQPINSELKTYENVGRIAAGKGDGYTSGCLLHYSQVNNKLLIPTLKQFSKLI